MQSTSITTPQKDLNKMQQQSQSVYVPSGNSNAPGNVRQQQPQLYTRNTPPSAPVPRSHPRHNSAIMTQPLYQQVIMQYPPQQQFTQRSVQYQAAPQFGPYSQLPMQNPPLMQYSYFQIPPINQASGVNCIPTATPSGQPRPVPSGSIVQTSNGAILTGSASTPAHSQIITASNVLQQPPVNAAGPPQVQVAGANPTLVGGVVAGPGQQSASSGMVSHNRVSNRDKGKRKHAIPIIDPATNKDILEEVISNDKNQNITGNELEYPENKTSISGIVNNITNVIDTVSAEYIDQTKAPELTYSEMPQKIPEIPMETPIVSAKTKAPSVEIHQHQQPKPQKRAKSKQNEIVTSPQSEPVNKPQQHENKMPATNIKEQKTQQIHKSATYQQQESNRNETPQVVNTKTTRATTTTTTFVSDSSTTTPVLSTSATSFTPGACEQMNINQSQQNPTISEKEIPKQQNQFQPRDNKSNNENSSISNTMKSVQTSTNPISNYTPDQSKAQNPRQQHSHMQKTQNNRNSESNKQQSNRSNTSNVNSSSHSDSVSVATAMTSVNTQTVSSSSKTPLITGNISKHDLPSRSSNTVSKREKSIPSDELDSSVSRMDNVDFVNNNNDNIHKVIVTETNPVLQTNDIQKSENVLIGKTTVHNTETAKTKSTSNSNDDNNNDDKDNKSGKSNKKVDCDNKSDRETSRPSNESVKTPMPPVSEHDHETKNITLTQIENSSLISPSLSYNNPGETESSALTKGILEQNEQQAASNSLISYNDGQWSPHNREGKKEYTRDQLMQLREAPFSNIVPHVDNKAASLLLSSSRSPNNQNQPNLMPSFARHTKNKRNQSMGNPSGSSGSLGDASFLKNRSTSIVNPKNNAKGSKSDMIHISLSLREDIKLNQTENAWRPHFKQELTTEESNKEELKRNVRGILNKLTPEKFGTLAEQILKLHIDTAEKINDVMVLVFEKAIEEPNFSEWYAKLCDRLSKEVKLNDKTEKKNLTIFRNALLDKTEHEFMQNVTNQKSKESKLMPLQEKLAECQDPEQKLELQEQLEEEERKIRRRSGGTVRFIGELFKMNMLTVNILKSCITALLDQNSEDKLECLCKLLTTVGKVYESMLDSKTKKKCSLEHVMKDMQAIVDRKNSSKISSRIRFMLQDVIDLRKNHWVSSKTEIPKTMDQIQKEAKTEQMSSQYLNYTGTILNNSSNSGDGGSGSSGNIVKKDMDSGNRRMGGNYGMNSMGNFGSGSGGGNTGGGNRTSKEYYKSRSGNNQQQDSEAWFTQTSKGKAIDANKLTQMSSSVRDMDTGITKLGGSSQFQWKTTAASTTTSKNSFAALSGLDSNKNSGSAPRNKGSFNKNSMEKDRYSSQHGSRESSTSRNQQRDRNYMNDRLRNVGDRDERDRLREQRNDRSTAGMTMRKTSSQQNYSSSSASPSSSRSSSKTVSLNIQDDASSPATSTPVFDSIDNLGNPKLFAKAIKQLVTIKQDGEPLNELDVVILNFPESKRWGLFYHIFITYLHMVEVKHNHRKALAEITEYLYNKKIITVEDIKKGYLDFSPLAFEVCIDVPDAWQYIFEYLGPLIQKKVLDVKDLWNDELKISKMGSKFIKHLILYFTKEIGPNYMQKLWRTQNIKLSDFISEDKIESFIKENKFQFLSIDTPYEVTKQEDINTILKRVKELLNQNANKDDIMDYLSANIKTPEDPNNPDKQYKQFIRGLTTELLEYCIVKNSNGKYELDKQRLRLVCSPLLNRYIDSKSPNEMECLFAVQILMNQLEHPPGLILDIFVQLEEFEIINQDSFLNWRNSKEEPTGKGVAVTALYNFFNDVLNSGSSDENN